MIKDILQNVLSQVAKQREIKPFQHNRATRRLPIKERDIVTQIRDFFSEMNTDTARKLYSYFYFLALNHKVVCPTQKKAGDFADIVDRTVRRILELFKRANIIGMHNRGYNTCVYLMPKELFGLQVMRQLEDLFPFLKRVTFLALFLSGRPMESRNVLPISQDYPRLLNTYKFTEEEGTLAEEISNKRKTVNQFISPVNQTISARMRLTECGMLQNTAFDDKTLQIAYDEWRELKDLKKKTYPYFFGICRLICKRMNKTPNYAQMTLAVALAGYKPGDKTMVSDPDAQPRYDAKVEIQQRKIPSQMVDAAPKESIHPDQSYWLNQFPIPKRVLNKEY